MRACRKPTSGPSHDPSPRNQGRTTFFLDEGGAAGKRNVVRPGFWPRGAPMSLLSIRRLEGGYGRLTVFRDVSLELGRDQTIGLLGANGAGKATLMKTIAGALPATSGSVQLQGRDLTKEPAYMRARRGLGQIGRAHV